MGKHLALLAIPVTRILVAFAYNTKLNGNVYFGNGVSTGGVQPLANTMAFIAAEDNITHQATYTVPAGYSLYVKQIYGSTSKNDELIVSGFRSPFGMTHYIKGTDIYLNSNSSQITVGYFRIEEKTDIVVTAKSFTNTATAHGGVVGVLIKDTYLVK